MNCENDCIELKKVNLELERIQNASDCRDVEHEQIQNNLSNRITSMESKFDELRKEVKDDIASIKADLPVMFESAINRLLARVAKWLLAGLGVILLVIILAMSRPVILQGINEIKNKVETYQTD